MSTPWFADRIAFVDLETTGMSPGKCRITEIGIVLLSCSSGWEPTHWSSLVNPGVPIAPEIRFLTGISNEMVADAPSFAQLAPLLRTLLADAVFVAHHARFDYGFIKQAFAEQGHDFTAKTLCTVRLSKLLDPDRSPHSLDALIHRHALPAQDRHRALGDARIIWHYLDKMYRRRGADVVNDAVRRLLRQPSLPAHLPPDALSSIPNLPGVYQFLGVNDQPLYIGKSIHLRERVASHFVNDHRSERGVRLASEIRRIHWQCTAGDFGAQLLERQLIRTLAPSHNAALRRKSRQIVLLPQSHGALNTAALNTVAPKTGALKAGAPLRWRQVDALAVSQLAGCFGPFGSRASARRLLTEIAAASGLCLASLGIERVTPGSPCFNRQLGRCHGCCVGIDSIGSMLDRMEQALAPYRIDAWPFAGAIVIEEDADDGQRIDHHVLDQWSYLGTAASAEAASGLIADATRQFDADCYRLIRKALSTELILKGTPSPAAPGPDDSEQTPQRPAGSMWRLRLGKFAQFEPEFEPEFVPVTAPAPAKAAALR